MVNIPLPARGLIVADAEFSKGRCATGLVAHLMLIAASALGALRLLPLLQKLADATFGAQPDLARRARINCRDRRLGCVRGDDAGRAGLGCGLKRSLKVTVGNGGQLLPARGLVFRDAKIRQCGNGLGPHSVCTLAPDTWLRAALCHLPLFEQLAHATLSTQPDLARLGFRIGVAGLAGINFERQRLVMPSSASGALVAACDRCSLVGVGHRPAAATYYQLGRASILDWYSARQRPVSSSDHSDWYA